MAKKIEVKKVVSAATVYGPTEIDAAKAMLDSLPSEKLIFRSDYLDKLADAVSSRDENYLVAVGDITIEKLDSAKGINGDHPYVTFETPAKRSEGRSKTYRAWRYIAIAD